jgi:biopolymer transport protein ExbB/TolQ
MAKIEELHTLPPELDAPQLNWSQDDIEQRAGFKGGRFTDTNKLLTFLMGVILTVLFYVFVLYVLRATTFTKAIAAMFLDRGIVPYPTTFFFFWAISILFLKARKLAYQERSLELAAVPQQPDFVLNPTTARAVLERIYSLVDNTRNFVLLNRIERALSNLRNIGQISDVSDILRTQATYDEEQLSSSYSLINGFTWSIPVLGFIGTVLGLSQAIGAFGLTLESAGDMAKLRDSLKDVTAGLATGFETTLVALVFALIIQLYVTFLQKKEYSFLDECNDYCHAHVVSKLRLTEN